MRKICGFIAVLVASVVGPTSGQAGGVLFSDDFDAEPVQLNATKLNQWTVRDGTIDVVANGTQGLRCADGGQCLDLDGSTSAAGRLVSNPIRLQPGSYVLSYQLSGNQRGGDDTVRVSFGVKKLRVLKLAADAPFKTYSDKFTLAKETTASIAFQNEGGDNVGLVLDGVRLTGAAAVVTGVARTAKGYTVVCQNVTTGAKASKTFLSMQAWDCAEMGLAIAPGDRFTATVSGQSK